MPLIRLVASDFLSQGFVASDCRHFQVLVVQIMVVLDVGESLLDVVCCRSLFVSWPVTTCVVSQFCLVVWFKIAGL